MEPMAKVHPWFLDIAHPECAVRAFSAPRKCREGAIGPWPPPDGPGGRRFQVAWRWPKGRGHCYQADRTRGRNRTPKEGAYGDISVP